MFFYDSATNYIRLEGPGAGSMLGQRLERWLNIKPASGQSVGLSEKSPFDERPLSIHGVMKLSGAAKYLSPVLITFDT